MRKSLVASFVVLVLVYPAMSTAQTTDMNSQMIALLQQILVLQKSLILSLQTQIADLSAKASGQQTTTHKCAIVTPLTCSTVLSVTYDSYNCVTSYSCKAVAETASASCSANGQTYASGQSVSGICPQGGLPFGGTCSGPMARQNGQWVQI